MVEASLVPLSLIVPPANATESAPTYNTLVFKHSPADHPASVNTN